MFSLGTGFKKRFCELFSAKLSKESSSGGQNFPGIKKGDKFHFIAMGGVGQSALAKILLQMGYEVSGSDMSDSKYLKELKELGAKVYIGHSAENVPKDAYIVLSSAIKDDNPELICARAQGLNILHRSDMLLAITHEFALTIGFAGTHGKTTTSGLASYVLSKMGAKAAYAVGGIIPELNTNANAAKDSEMFVAELDESDGTISKYTPEILVINNLEADHLDFYKNGLSDVLETFKNLILKQPDDIKIIVNADDSGVLELLKLIEPTDKKVIKFSFKEKCTEDFDTPIDICAVNIEFNSEGAEFDVVCRGEKLGRISTSLKGKHNVYNALAVISALIAAGYKFEEFAPHFKGFTGMGRRFQQVFKNDNVEIVDDYAHHPSEIRATLNAAYEYKKKSGKKRIVAIFQPHRYTRLKGLWKDFLSSFENVDLLFVSDVFSAGDMHDEEYNSEKFVQAACEKYPDRAGQIIYVPGKVDLLAGEITRYIKDGDLVLTLGAGDITKLGKFIGERL